MIPTPFSELEQDLDLQKWWQEVMNDPKFPRVINAVLSLLEQEPPKVLPPGLTPIENFALQHAANLGARVAINTLNNVGLTAMAELRVTKEQQANQNRLSKPSEAGRGYGRQAEVQQPQVPPPPLV